jgi:hypothetical protein
MRWPIVATTITLAGSATPARADSGAYIIETFGGASYRGELSRFDGGPRLQVGFGAWHGPWSLEFFGSGIDPNFFFIDCYGDECAYAAKPEAPLQTWGLDLRERWRIVSSPLSRKVGLFMTLHGGPRYVEASEALQGYRGGGLGVGASLDFNFWVIGGTIDFGTDVMRLEGPGGDVIHGSTPYVMFGMKLGWM